MGRRKDSNKTKRRMVFFLVTIPAKKRRENRFDAGVHKWAKNDPCPGKVIRLPFVAMGSTWGSDCLSGKGLEGS
jgi:hypothetical protein